MTAYRLALEHESISFDKFVNTFQFICEIGIKTEYRDCLSLPTPPLEGQVCENKRNQVFAALDVFVNSDAHRKIPPEWALFVIEK